MKLLKFGPAQVLVLVLALLAYQLALGQFSNAINSYGAGGSVLALLLAIAAMLIVFALPLVSLYMLMSLEARGASSPRMRMSLHILSCLPVLYTLTFLICLINGAPASFGWVWWVVAVNLACSIYLMPSALDSENPNRSASYRAIFRVFHGVAAAVFILGFLGMHLGNHLAALWGAEAHIAIMETLRTWYRHEWIEYLLLASAGFLVLSGFYMAQKRIRTGGDTLRMLQTATGSYLGFFIVTHVLAVLSSRQAGIDTNWYFAVSDKGLIWGPNILLPYYALSVVFVFVHVGLGIRQVVLAHKYQESRAKQLFKAVSALGMGVSVAIAAASVGVSI